MSAGAELRLKGKTVLITGGGSGVGFETAKLFYAAGCKLILVSRDEAKLGTAVQQFGSSAARYFVADVTDSSQVDAAFEFAHQSFGEVDILVNNAGTIFRQDAEHTSDKDWQKVMDINVNGVFFFSRAFARQCSLGGAIVNVSSTCAQVGAPGLAAYCASKGAVDQLTRSMALELAPRNITVNAVAPGAINSPMLYSKHADGVSNQSVAERNINSIPIGAIAEPVEVARSIVFLASERHITGTILSVDGGYTAQ